MEEQNGNVLIRRRAFYAAYDQNLDCLSHNHKSISGKSFSRFLNSFKTIYEFKCMENADLGKHCLLLHKPGFRRWRHTWCSPWDTANRTGIDLFTMKTVSVFYQFVVLASPSSRSSSEFSSSFFFSAYVLSYRSMNSRFLTSRFAKYFGNAAFSRGCQSSKTCK